jgi:hypothetical protein
MASATSRKCDDETDHFSSTRKHRFGRTKLRKANPPRPNRDDYVSVHAAPPKRPPKNDATVGLEVGEISREGCNLPTHVSYGVERGR